MIDYALDNGRDDPEQYRLLTTILDPEQAAAEDLAFAYAQRWEIENTFDELKPTSVGRGRCCARNRRIWSCRKSGGTCVVTTRSAP